jgi:hypothetical protein
LAGGLLLQCVRTGGHVTTRSPTSNAITKRCTQIADTVVPEYRAGKRSYSCTGRVAKRWQAAWDGACIALGHAPEEFQ